MPKYPFSAAAIGLPVDIPDPGRRAFLKAVGIGYRTACVRIGEVLRAMWEFFGGAWMQPPVFVAVPVRR